MLDEKSLNDIMEEFDTAVVSIDKIKQSVQGHNAELSFQVDLVLFTMKKLYDMFVTIISNSQGG